LQQLVAVVFDYLDREVAHRRWLEGQEERSWAKVAEAMKS
jgi:hypothetical protein